MGGASSPADEGLAGELDAAASALGGAPTATAEHAVPARPSGAFLAAREDARPIQVVLRRDAVMRGARAALVLQRAEVLGAVSAVRPAPSHFDSQDFDGRFAFRLATAASEAEIEAALRAAGEVESVRFEADDAEGQSAAHGRQIRVDLGRLDTLMKQVGELVVAKNRLGALAAESSDPDLAEVSDRIARLASEMQAEVIAARMTPVGEVLERFPRVVRDLARDLGKRIRFDVEGGEIELDRSILDEIGPPLLHLIRNAADHGIESPEERIRAGKPEEGRILLSASRDRNSVALRLSDDGRGIDRERILAKARREGVVDAGAEALGDDVLLRVLARPGFSTAESVSGVSGRGVGVDVAVTKVRALGGTIEVRSELGKGTTFTIRVPLTLAIVRALLASAAGERYAVPLAYVAETVEFDPRSVTAVRDREALVVRDQVIPTVHLRDLVRQQPRPAPAEGADRHPGDRGAPRRPGGGRARRTAGHRGGAVRRASRDAVVRRRRDHSRGRLAGAHSRRRSAGVGGGMEDVRDLKELQLDALREVANIGAGHAATALSQMTNRTIMIAVPEVNIRALEDVTDLVGSPDT